MATNTSQIMKRVVKETGYNSTVVGAVLRSFFKQTLWALIKDEDHKVVLTNFVTMEMKPTYPPGTVRMGLEVSQHSRKLITRFTSNILKKVPTQGIEQVVKDIWGDE